MPYRDPEKAKAHQRQRYFEKKADPAWLEQERERNRVRMNQKYQIDEAYRATSNVATRAAHKRRWADPIARLKWLARAQRLHLKHREKRQAYGRLVHETRVQNGLTGADRDIRLTLLEWRRWLGQGRRPYKPRKCPAALDVEVHGSHGGVTSTQLAIEARVPDRNPLAW